MGQGCCGHWVVLVMVMKTWKYFFGIPYLASPDETSCNVASWANALATAAFTGFLARG